MKLLKYNLHKWPIDLILIGSSLTVLGILLLIEAERQTLINMIQSTHLLLIGQTVSLQFLHPISACMASVLLLSYTACALPMALLTATYPQASTSEQAVLAIEFILVYVLLPIYSFHKFNFSMQRLVTNGNVKYIGALLFFQCHWTLYEVSLAVF